MRICGRVESFVMVGLPWLSLARPSRSPRHARRRKGESRPCPQIAVAGSPALGQSRGDVQRSSVARQRGVLFSIGTDSSSTGKKTDKAKQAGRIDKWPKGVRRRYRQIFIYL